MVSGFLIIVFRSFKFEAIKYLKPKFIILDWNAREVLADIAMLRLRSPLQFTYVEIPPNYLL